jgi:hypothetical protein
VLFTARQTQVFPVEGLMLLLPLHQHLLEQLPHVVIVGLFLELQSPHVLEIPVQHQTVVPERFHEIVDLGHLLETPNFRVLLGLRVDLDALPRQLADEEVEQQVPQRLQVVSATLLVPFMRGNAGVAGSADEAFSALYGDVVASLEVSVALGEAEVDDVDCAAVLPPPRHEVVGLDISVHEALPVNLFEPRHDLRPYCQRGRQRERLRAAFLPDYHIWNSSSSDSSSRSIIMNTRSWVGSLP